MKMHKFFKHLVETNNELRKEQLIISLIKS
ncbi:MAG: hypothetical protein JWR18_525 [Segetibacter sp.]|nr:hypothetical protein [Segetibacter sp.]